MRCLSVRQPWAHLIIHGDTRGRIKEIENRDWKFPVKYRGPLLIHAAKSVSCIGEYGADEPAASEMAFGAIIGIVELVDCVPYEVCKGRPFAEGPMCLVLANRRAFKTAVPYLGKLSLFEVPDELVESGLS